MSDSRSNVGADGSRNPAKDEEKNRQKAEKLRKFEEKRAKLTASQAVSKPEKTKSKTIADVPAYDDPTPFGEKKIQPDLDHASLRAYNPAAVESSHYAWWEKMNFFAPSPELTNTSGADKPFVIIEPPPNVTGALHMGHALSGTLQDIMIRYHRMQGKSVLWLPGCDHAGIATQTVVEKMLWRTQQKTRHDIGRAEFLKLAMEWKESYHSKISATKRRLGLSVDWTREAFTMDQPRREAVTEAFVRLHRDGTIYRANRIVHWDTQLRTAISNLEVDSIELKGRTKLSVPGYDRKVDFGVMTYFQYEIDGSTDRVAIATTRPETMLGDTGLAVNPQDERYRHLVGKTVRHPFVEGRLLRIVADEHVDCDFGTGIVKITPAHDQNDFGIGMRHGLPFINILNDDGTLNSNAGPFAGQRRYDARYSVVAALKEKGLYLKEEDNAMALKLSERSQDVIEPMMKPQWWMKMKGVAKEAVKAVESGDITIFPASEERKYYRWMQDIEDWCLSRQLWWGHRIPAYYAVFDGDQSAFGSDDSRWFVARSEAEARQIAESKFPDKTFTLEQDADVFDTWFSSGLWPFSTLGWPHNTADLAGFYPTSMLMTAWDILFPWVSRMIMMGLKLNNAIPFNEVYCHPIVRDSEGRKMSKSLGNVIDPLDVVNGISLADLHKKLEQGNLDPKELQRAMKYQKTAFPDGIPQCGTDALRFSLAAYSTGVTDVDFDIKVMFGWRKFCNKIYQAAKYVLRSLGTDFVPRATVTKTGQESLAEKWMLHRLTIAASDMNDALTKRAFGRCTTIMHQFWIHDLCDTFIEQSKYLLTLPNGEVHASVQQTLYTALDGGLALLHPFMPYLTEELWQRLPRRDGDETPSIMLSRYPTFNKSFVDEVAKANYDTLLDVCRAIRSLVATYSVSSGATVFCGFHDASGLQTARDHLEDVKILAGKGVESIEILNLGQSVPEGCVMQDTGSATVFLHVLGQVDFEKELEKTRSKLDVMLQCVARSQKAVDGLQSSDKATDKALVAEQAKLADYENEVQKMTEIVRQFEGLRVAGGP